MSAIDHVTRDGESYLLLQQETLTPDTEYETTVFDRKDSRSFSAQLLFEQDEPDLLVNIYGLAADDEALSAANLVGVAKSPVDSAGAPLSPGDRQFIVDVAMAAHPYYALGITSSVAVLVDVIVNLRAFRSMDRADKLNNPVVLNSLGTTAVASIDCDVTKGVTAGEETGSTVN